MVKYRYGKAKWEERKLQNKTMQYEEIQEVMSQKK